MKASELRIGNLIHNGIMSLGSGTISITSDEIVFMERFPEQNTYLPIAITQEWLLGFGFEKTKTRQLRIKVGMSSNGLETIYLSMYVYRGEVSVSLAKMITKIQYVHELQNLYYSLTGKELLFEKYSVQFIRFYKCKKCGNAIRKGKMCDCGLI